MLKKLNFEGRRVPRKQFTTEGPSLTKQASKKDADINNIVAKYHRTGLLPMVQAQALYADVSTVVDYQQAMEIKLKAETQFNALPVETRNRFDNDPSKFLAFAESAKNKEEIVELVTGVKRSKEHKIEPGTGGAEQGAQAPST